VSRRPEQAPLGATPTLPPPRGASAKTAATLFTRAMQRDAAARAQRESTQDAPSPEEDARAAGGGSSPSFGGGRRYDLALALVGFGPAGPGGGDARDATSYDSGLAAEAPIAAQAQELATGDEVTQLWRTDPGVAANSAAVVKGTEPCATPPRAGPSLAEAAALPRRPPPGAPTVRPSAPRPSPDEDADWQTTLNNTAQALQMVAEPDGSTAFEVTLRDDVLQDVTCRVAIREHRLTATFRVADVSLRRLLEGESGRLRARLEERGLHVEEIRVIEE